MVTQLYNENTMQVVYITSDETKPTDCSNGSKLVEVDTGKEYRFDEENKLWIDFSNVKVMR